MTEAKLQNLLSLIEQWSQEYGFSAFGVSDLNLEAEKATFDRWLENQYNASMDWLEKNNDKRFKPEKLVPGVRRSISFRMNYLPDGHSPIENLKRPEKAYISRYALGRDYHKLIRKRLAKLSQKIHDYAVNEEIIQNANTRVFVDSAPVLERPLAEKAGVGWTGKHSLILDKDDGSWFFLGEIFTNIPFPANQNPSENACGSCEACLHICPTDAFPKPYVLDARRCISYLTIEHEGPIPEEFREPMGNRIFGCDDCQLICPWNNSASHTKESDFSPRHNLENVDLIELFLWDEEEFLKCTEGSAIRRAGYDKWQRNIAVALGNATQDLRIIEALKQKREFASPLVREHIDWALERQTQGKRRKRKIKNPEKIKPSPTAPS